MSIMLNVKVLNIQMLNVPMLNVPESFLSGAIHCENAICPTCPQNVLLINLCHRSPEPSEIH